MHIIEVHTYQTVEFLIPCSCITHKLKISHVSEIWIRELQSSVGTPVSQIIRIRTIVWSKLFNVNPRLLAISLISVGIVPGFLRIKISMNKDPVYPHYICFKCIDQCIEHVNLVISRPKRSIYDQIYINCIFIKIFPCYIGKARLSAFFRIVYYQFQ